MPEKPAALRLFGVVWSLTSVHLEVAILNRGALDFTLRLCCGKQSAGLWVRLGQRWPDVSGDCIRKCCMCANVSAEATKEWPSVRCRE